MKKIMIIKSPVDREALIDAIALRWTETGHHVFTCYGTQDLPEADVVIVHVDTTCLPIQYQELVNNYPVVINGKAVTIDKALYCHHRITETDDYPGEVIIKTKENYGVICDERYQNRKELLVQKLVRRLLPLFRSRQENWRCRRTLDPLNYPILERKEDVPAGVWENENLMVERFVPEREGDLFYIRYWIFLGNQGWARRFGSRRPVAKFGTRVTDEETVSVPRELIELRDCMGLDYGRFDYVQHGNRVMVFDVNKTLGAGNNVDDFADELDELATGINVFLEEQEKG